MLYRLRALSEEAKTSLSLYGLTERYWDAGTEASESGFRKSGTRFHDLTLSLVSAPLWTPGIPPVSMGQLSPFPSYVIENLTALSSRFSLTFY